MRVSVPVWLIVLTILAMVALVVILWSVKRRRRAHIRLSHIDDTDSLMRSIAGFTQGRVVAGNSVTLVQNGRAPVAIRR